MLDIQLDKLNDNYGHIWDKHGTKLSQSKPEGFCRLSLLWQDKIKHSLFLTSVGLHYICTKFLENRYLTNK